MSLLSIVYTAATASARPGIAKLSTATCYDLGKQCGVTGTYHGACEAVYYSWDEPSLDGQFVGNVCPATCADAGHFPEKSCEEWQAFPNQPTEANVCPLFVSKAIGTTNADCQAVCAETAECTIQVPLAQDCYGDWMYGYSEEQAEMPPGWTYETRWENNMHYTVVLEVGSTPHDCQQLCQADEGCGFFGFREKGAESITPEMKPTCLLKKRSAVVLANSRHLRYPEDWECQTGPCRDDYDYCNLGLSYNCDSEMYDCKECEGEYVCAWKSYYHISGPKYCDGSDAWMENDDSCEVPETTFSPTTTKAPATTTKAPTTTTTQAPTTTDGGNQGLVTVPTTDGGNQGLVTVPTTDGGNQGLVTVPTTDGGNQGLVTVPTTDGGNQGLVTVPTTDGGNQGLVTVPTTDGGNQGLVTVPTTQAVTTSTAAPTTRPSTTTLPIVPGQTPPTQRPGNETTTTSAEGGNGYTTTTEDDNVGVVVGSAIGGVLAVGGAVVAGLMAKGIIPAGGASSEGAVAEDVELNDQIHEREQFHDFDGEMFA